MFLFAVTHLSGQARLHFTRHPYTHWSFSFFGDPVLELQVESQFQGRPLPQITSIIVSQVVSSCNIHRDRALLLYRTVRTLVVLQQV